MDMPIFGEHSGSQEPVERQGSYALLMDKGCVGAVEGRPGVFFLPGGGVQPGESPAQAVKRELDEELGATLKSLVPAGQAVQYFSAGEVHYRMLATFFQVRIGAVQSHEAEYELKWLKAEEIGRLFHECHRWAVRRHFAREHQ